MKFNNLVTKQPRKKRKQMYNATLKDLAPMSHLSKELREKEKKRSMRVRKGDTVAVLRGSFKGKNGKVTRVNTKTRRVYIEALVVKKQNNQEKPAPFEPSNLVITTLSERKEKK